MPNIETRFIPMLQSSTCIYILYSIAYKLMWTMDHVWSGWAKNNPHQAHILGCSEPSLGIEYFSGALIWPCYVHSDFANLQDFAKIWRVYQYIIFTKQSLLAVQDLGVGAHKMCYFFDKTSASIICLYSNMELPRFW